MRRSFAEAEQLIYLGFSGIREDLFRFHVKSESCLKVKYVTFFFTRYLLTNAYLTLTEGLSNFSNGDKPL